MTAKKTRVREHPDMIVFTTDPDLVMGSGSIIKADEKLLNLVAELAKLATFTDGAKISYAPVGIIYRKVMNPTDKSGGLPKIR